MVKIKLSSSLLEKITKTSQKLLAIKAEELAYSSALLEEMDQIHQILKEEEYKGKNLSEIIDKLFLLFERLENHLNFLMEEVVSPDLVEARDHALFIKQHFSYIRELRRLGENDLLKRIKQKENDYLNFSQISDLKTFLSLIEHLQKSNDSSKVIEKEMKKLQKKLEKIVVKKKKYFFVKKHKPILKEILSCRDEILELEDLFSFTIEKTRNM